MTVGALYGDGDAGGASLRRRCALDGSLGTRWGQFQGFAKGSRRFEEGVMQDASRFAVRSLLASKPIQEKNQGADRHRYRLTDDGRSVSRTRS
jgi:hypothetical protein